MLLYLRIFRLIHNGLSSRNNDILKKKNDILKARDKGRQGAFLGQGQSPGTRFMGIKKTPKPTVNVNG
jgi:hypothetical protein